MTQTFTHTGWIIYPRYVARHGDNAFGWLADEAAAALHITASDLSELGLVDGVVADFGLTHTEIAHDLMREVELALDELAGLDAGALLGQRYDKFRAMGGNRICSR